MLFNLLAEQAENNTSWTSYIPIIIIVLLLVAFFVWSFLSQKKKQKAFNDTVNAIRPGSKVKTIGGVVGEVVEVDDAEGTFVLKTGDSEGNCSYMKFDKQAIYQTDAKPAEPAKEEKKAPEPAETAAPAEPFEAHAEDAAAKEDKTEEVNAEETSADEKKDEAEDK